jgi:hypothetical protein
MGLQDEAAPKEGPGEDKLREYGLGKKEIDFLIHKGRRVELNAMPTDVLVAWLEGKLEEHSGGKVVPDAEVLERHGRRLIERCLMLARIAPLIEEVESEAARVTLPDDLAELVEQELERTPELAWEEALERVLADVTPEADA